MLNEWVLPKVTNATFSFKKIPNKNGKGFVDEQCAVCKKRIPTYKAKNAPRMCRPCYLAIRAYQKYPFDILSVRKRGPLDLKSARTIVKHEKGSPSRRIASYMSIIDTLKDINRNL